MRFDDDVYYYNCWRLKLEGETENMGVCTKERRGGTAEVLMAPLPALIHWEVKLGGTSMKDVGGASFAGSSPPFLGRERAAVDVDPERRSPRYHVTDSVYNQKYRERTFKSAVLSMQVGGLTGAGSVA